MHAKRLAIGLVALAALTYATGTASAGDTMRLSIPGSPTAPTLNLKATDEDLSADTVAARYYGGGFRGFGGGFRGVGVGFRGIGFGRGIGYGYGRGIGIGYGRGFGYGYGRGFVGYGRGFVGYRRGFVGGYWGPRYFGGYYGSGYGGYGGYPVYSGGYYGSGYCGYPVYSGAYYGSSYYSSDYSNYGYGYGCSPCGGASITIGSLTASVGPPTTIYSTPSYSTPSYVTPGYVAPSYSTPSYTPPMPRADESVPALPGQTGTYPYDGGPSQGVPMPPAEESAVKIPRLSKPALVEDLVVSLPEKKTGKWKYPAYGDAPTRTGSR